MRIYATGSQNFLSKRKSQVTIAGILGNTPIAELDAATRTKLSAEVNFNPQKCVAAIRSKQCTFRPGSQELSGF